MKYALITGSSRGIGASIAVALAQQGYGIIINYKNNEEKAENLAKVLNDSYNVPVFCMKCDVSDYTQVKEMFDVIESKIGGIDVLVNNAGIARQEIITDVSVDRWQEMIGTNLNSVFYCSKCALPYMISQKSGVIINISSMWGQVGASCEVAYSTAKAGVIGFTKALAKEVGPSNIRVNAISPGVISTDMMQDFDETTINQLKEETPLSAIGTPKNIADGVAFLVSDKANFITGQNLAINGGFVI